MTTTDKPLSERVHLANVTDEVPRAYYVCDDDVEDLPHDEFEAFAERFKKRFGCLPHGKDDWFPPDAQTLRFKLTDAFREIEALRAENTELRERVKALEPVRFRTYTIPVLPHNYPNTFEGYGVDDAELVAVVKHDNGQVFAYFKERIDTPPEDTP